MPEIDPKIAELEARLENLVRTQIGFQTEISAIRNELTNLRQASAPSPPITTKLEQPSPETESYIQTPPSVPAAEVPIDSYSDQAGIRPPRETPRYESERPQEESYSTSKPSAGEPSRSGAADYEPYVDTSHASTSAFNKYVDDYVSSARENLEKFIGENLISKIGILVLVLGVGIGAKYAIDNDLISPLARIIVAYIFGFGLIGLAVRLKPKYHNFSAVLVSGGMAIMYFVTYFAYAAYALINQPTAFVLMTIFTVFTVSAAMIYDRQVIAHVGLVGAYAVPFLLSNNSGNFLFLFSYMTVLNGGILAISVRKDWKALFYTSFVFTWAIYGGWLATKYSAPEHFYLALVFLAIFTAFFLGTRLIPRGRVETEEDEPDDSEKVITVGVTVAVFYFCLIALGNAPADTTRYVVFLTYLAASSLTILAITMSNFRKVIYLICLLFVWLAYALWLDDKYVAAEHFYLALVFLGIYAAIFIGITIVQDRRNEGPEEDAILRLSMLAAPIVVFYCCFLAIGKDPADPIRYAIFLTYLAATTLTILVITVRNFQKVIYTICFAFVWLAFGLWLSDKYVASEHFYLALAFLALFPAIFFAVCIVQGVLYKDPEEDARLRLLMLAAPVVAFYFCFFSVSNVDTTTPTYAILFSYLAAITVACVTTSFRYYGKALIFVCYPLVWLAFGSWMARWYVADAHFGLGLIFSAIFFSIFYLTAMILRLRYDELTVRESTAITLTNSFLFYGATFNVMHSRESLHSYLGLFTAGHSTLHLITANIVGWIRSSAVDIVQMLAVLVLTFATIAIPVQFDGNTITLIWAVEGALLFWFGRVRQVRTFEYYSYPVMILAIGSLVRDWGMALGDRLSRNAGFDRTPLMNGDFVTGLVFVAAFFLIFQTNRDRRNKAVFGPEIVRRFGGVIAAVAIVALYNTFRVEIANYFHLQTLAAGIVSPMSALTEPTLTAGYDIVRLNASWQLVYTMFFLTGIAAVNLKRARSAILAFVGVALSVLMLATFSTAGMYLFSQMRIGYMLHPQDVSNVVLPMNILIRYITYLFTGALLFSVYRTTRDELITDTIGERKLMLGYDALLYSTLLIASSCDLINVMAQFHLPDGTRWGLSILWGAFALGMIVIGIAWNKAHLRIAAICLLAVTLVKLFFYDIAELGTIPKTILFVSLGILLLIISFLYNKYKSFIFGTNLSDEDGPLP